MDARGNAVGSGDGDAAGKFNIKDPPKRAPENVYNKNYNNNTNTYLLKTLIP